MPKRTKKSHATDATTDLTWASVWSQWSSLEVHAWFFQAAYWGHLNFEQCKALMQGDPPPPTGSFATVAVAPRLVAAVGRLRFDMKHRGVPPFLLPIELASWCDQAKIELPVMFVYGLFWKACGRDPFARSPQAPVTTHFEWWLPRVLSPVPVIEPPSRRGRPRLARPIALRMRQEGAKIMMQAASDERILLTLREVARRLRAKPDFADKTIDNIVCQLKRFMPRALARESARRAIVSHRSLK